MDTSPVCPIRRSIRRSPKKNPTYRRFRDGSRITKKRTLRAGIPPLNRPEHQCSLRQPGYPPPSARLWGASPLRGSPSVAPKERRRARGFARQDTVAFRRFSLPSGAHHASSLMGRPQLTLGLPSHPGIHPGEIPVTRPHQASSLDANHQQPGLSDAISVPETSDDERAGV